MSRTPEHMAEMRLKSQTALKAKREALIEDALFLLETKEHPESIAKRLNTSVSALERHLRREGHVNEANKFEMINFEERQRAKNPGKWVPSDYRSNDAEPSVGILHSPRSRSAKE